MTTPASGFRARKSVISFRSSSVNPALLAVAPNGSMERLPGTGRRHDFRPAMVGRADKGLIMTTGTFTADVRHEATREGAPPIDLVDGEAFCQLLKYLKLGIHVRLVEEVDVEEEFFDTIRNARLKRVLGML